MAVCPQNGIEAGYRSAVGKTLDAHRLGNDLEIELMAYADAGWPDPNVREMPCGPFQKTIAIAIAPVLVPQVCGLGRSACPFIDFNTVVDDQIDRQSRRNARRIAALGANGFVKGSKICQDRQSGGVLHENPAGIERYVELT